MHLFHDSTPEDRRKQKYSCLSGYMEYFFSPLVYIKNQNFFYMSSFDMVSIRVGPAGNQVVIDHGFTKAMELSHV
jgi:hypothetical protein